MLQFLPTGYLTYQSAEERTEDDTCGTKEQTDHKPDKAPYNTPPGAAVSFRSYCGKDIVQHRHHQCDNAPNDNELPGERPLFLKLQQQECDKAQRRTRQHRHDAAHNAQ